MKAYLDAHELKKAFDFVSKGIRAKKLRERAKASLIFTDDSVCVEFNDLSTTCPGEIFQQGKYVLNPFVFRPLLETFHGKKLLLEINQDGVKIGGLRVAHLRLHGWFEEHEKALRLWEEYRRTYLKKRQNKIEKELKSKALSIQNKDELSEARHLAFKRVDGGIEYGAAVLKIERGEAGKRKVLVKTNDFQEIWINELDIVSYGKEPTL